jgi:hypothetical protein
MSPSINGTLNPTWSPHKRDALLPAQEHRRLPTSLDIPSGLSSRRTNLASSVSPRAESSPLLHSSSQRPEGITDTTPAILCIDGRTEARRSTDLAGSFIGLASSFEGQSSMNDGQLHSQQPQINTLLRHANLDPAQLKRSAGEALTFALDPDIAWMRTALDHASAVKEVNVRPHENIPLLDTVTKQEIDATLLIMHMQEMLQKNGSAPSNAVLHLPDGQSTSLHETFAEVRPSNSSSHTGLSGTVQPKYDDRASLAAASQFKTGIQHQRPMTEGPCSQTSDLDLPSCAMSLPQRASWKTSAKQALFRSQVEALQARHDALAFQKLMNKIDKRYEAFNPGTQTGYGGMPGVSGDIHDVTRADVQSVIRHIAATPLLLEAASRKSATTKLFTKIYIREGQNGDNLRLHIYRPGAQTQDTDAGQHGHRWRLDSMFLAGGFNNMNWRKIEDPGDGHADRYHEYELEKTPRDGERQYCKSVGWKGLKL